MMNTENENSQDISLMFVNFKIKIDKFLVTDEIYNPSIERIRCEETADNCFQKFWKMEKKSREIYGNDHTKMLKI